MVQRGHAYAIVDEVDSILIDEARTPLIISGEGDKSTDLYRAADEFVKKLKVKVFADVDDKEEHDEEVGDDIDYIVVEKQKTASLTQNGIHRAESYFHVANLADAENMALSFSLASRTLSTSSPLPEPSVL